MTSDRWIRLYLNSASVILVFAAIFKLVALIQHEPFFSRRDSLVSSVMVSQLLMLAAVLEVIVSLVITLAKQLYTWHKLFLVSWIATLFSIYRLGLALVGESLPCRCFGNLFGWLGVRDEFVNGITLGLLLYLLIPGLVYFCVKLPAAIWNAST